MNTRALRSPRPLARRARHLLLGCLVASMVGGTGCDQLKPLITGLIQGLLSTAVNPSSTTGATAATNTTTGGLGTTTANAPGASPAAQVPAPAASRATIDRIRAEYNITVTGVGAEGAALQKVATGLVKYSKQNLEGMRSIDMPRAQNGSNILGTWSMGNVVFNIQGSGTGVTEATVLHELGHHATLQDATREAFKTRLLSAVGTAQSRFPSEYAKSHDDELAAEVLAFALCSSPCDEQPLSSWQLESAASNLIQTEVSQPAAADGVTL